MNAYGYLHNYDQPVYTPDFNFINAALTYKQGKIDANRQKLQSLYDQFSILKVSKDVDQEYIDGRLQQVKDIANKYRNVDFSDDAFSASMMSTVSQVLDDKVKNAVLSTKRMQAEDAAWAQLKEKHPDKYAELNHQYAIAKSDRQRYLSTQEAGDMYGGGANTIEYRDLSKKIMEHMPKLQEMLKAKFFQTSDGGGYFQYQDTYEVVNPNQLRGALTALLDEKDRQQMGINAWGSFGQLPEESLRKAYDSKFVPEVEAHEDKIADLRTLISTTKDPKKVAVYEKELEIVQQRFTDLQSRDFDSIVKLPNGKDRLAESLYEEDFIGGIVQTYSTPRLVDRDIDKVHQASVEFGQKLAEFEWDKKMDLGNLSLKQAEFAWKQQGGTGSKKGTGAQQLVGDQDGVIYLQDKEMDYERDFDSVMDMKIKEEDVAIKGFSDIFGARPSVTNYGKIVKEFGDLHDKLEKGGSITLFGKTVKVTNANYEKLLRFKNNIIEDSITDKQLGQWASNTTLGAIDNLSRLVANSEEFGGAGSDINPFELPNFGWKYDDKMQKVQTKNGTHHYVHLLKKAGQKGFDTLSKSEQATLKAYTAAHAIGDKADIGWSDAQREKYFRETKKDLVLNYGVTGKAVAETFSDRKKIEGAFSVSYGYIESLKNFENVYLPEAVARVLGSSKRGDIQGGVSMALPSHLVSKAQKIKPLYDALQKDPENRELQVRLAKAVESVRVDDTKDYVKTKKSGQDFFVSEIGESDAEYNNKLGAEVSLGSFKDLFRDASLQAETALKEYKTSLNKVSYTPPTYTPKNPDYGKLVLLAQSAGANIKSTHEAGITIEPEIKPDGSYGEYARVFYEETVKGRTGRPFVNVKMSDLQKNLGINFQPIVRSPYDANFGKAAKPIEMGSGNFFENPRDVFQSNFDYLAAQISQYDDENKTLSNITTAYVNGELKFALEPGDKGVYVQTIRDQSGQLLGSFPTENNRFTYDAVTQLQSNSSTFASEVFTTFISKAIEERKELAKLKKPVR